MDNLIKKAKMQIADCVKKSYFTLCDLNGIEKNTALSIEVEVPNNRGFGNFSTNIAMKAAKTFNMPPKNFASLIIENTDIANTYIEKLEIAGPGFINFYLKNEFLWDILKSVFALDFDYGKSDINQDKKVLVEFVSANPTGPMHIGNARGGALGDCLSSVLKWSGYTVTKEFYINDTGNQIEKFGISLNTRFLQAVYGEDKIQMPENAYHGEDIKEHINDLIEKNGTEQYLKLDEDERIKTFVDYALKSNIEKLRSDTKRYKIEYDNWFSESVLHQDGEVTEVIQALKANGYTYEKDDAIWFNSEKFGGGKDEVLVRNNGIPTYFAADIAYHKNKYLRGYDLMIDIWGADHHGHVERMKNAMSAIGLDANKLQVILMQLVRLIKDNDVYKVSKRSGKAVTLTDLLDETGADAARFFFNLRQANTHFDFDLDLAIKETNDNPVFYVQYAHARICSIIRLLESDGIRVSCDADLTLLDKPEELELIEKIALFPEEIENSAFLLEPSKITKYILDLATLFHSFYNAVKVKTDDLDITNARLYLINAVRITLRNALNVLGIDAPEKM